MASECQLFYIVVLLISEWILRDICKYKFNFVSFRDFL